MLAPMTFTSFELTSERLGNTRKIWLANASDGVAAPLVVLLDGEYYVEKMGIVPTLIALMTRGRVPLANFAFVSHVDSSTRWRESFCNLEFVKFLTANVLGAVSERLGSEPTVTALGGLSLTGLAAAHAALAAEHAFDRVICQSASFWWSDEWLVKNVASFARGTTRFRMCCGTREVDTDVDHGDGLIQATSQIESNKRMRDALATHGFPVDFETYDGGHQLAPWANDLPRSLRSVLS